jgi:DNA repair exonuclease SbcCD ATPase subunit
MEEVTTIFFGPEDEEDARFVQLADCPHLVHAESLDRYVREAVVVGVVRLPECPVCKTPIRKTLRYNSVINSHMKAVEKVKDKLRGEKNEKHKKGIVDEIKKKLREEVLKKDDKDEPLFKEKESKFLGDLVKSVTSSESALGVPELRKCQQTLESIYILRCLGPRASKLNVKSDSILIVSF